MKELGQNMEAVDLEPWISTIRARWEKVPEFRVDTSKFRHLAIICDGNRRSAQEKGLHPWYGHRLGLEVIKGVMDASRVWRIKHLTFWAWSTENWKRDEKQVSFIMNLAAKYLREEEAIRKLEEHKVKFVHLGRKDRLHQSVRSAIENLEVRTSGFNDFYINLALDYGGLDEVARAIVKINKEIGQGRIDADRLLKEPEIIINYMDTGGQPAPDLVIRTGVKSEEIPHTSGFMPTQSSYAGWAFAPELFPDLSPKTLLREIERFTTYQRRFGE